MKKILIEKSQQGHVHINFKYVNVQKLGMVFTTVLCYFYIFSGTDQGRMVDIHPASFFGLSVEVDKETHGN